MGRKYQLKRRAEHQEETRRRIVEAAVELHESVGVAHTTIRAIAERAGVERATVYRHFPDERSLFTACTGHYLAANPPPDPAPLQRIADPTQRLQVGLAEIYAYHRRTEKMTSKAQRDLPQFPVLAEVLAPYDEQWARIGEVLAAGWQTQKDTSKLMRAAIGHAMNFQTWRSLARAEELDDTEAVRLMVAMIRCGAQGSEDENRHHLQSHVAE
ncbi:MAG: TetR/AcrR family transcriptional regulator [Chloroflexota bacterium]|nr:TetR/AcrR family transcriptional regulator [Chloroflexota bacterium]